VGNVELDLCFCRTLPLLWVARAGHGQAYPKVFRLCKSVGIPFAEQGGLVVLPSAFMVNIE